MMLTIFLSLLPFFLPQILIKFQSDTMATGSAPFQTGPGREVGTGCVTERSTALSALGRELLGRWGSRGQMLGWLTCGAVGATIPPPKAVRQLMVHGSPLGERRIVLASYGCCNK